MGLVYPCCLLTDSLWVSPGGLSSPSRLPVSWRRQTPSLFANSVLSRRECLLANMYLSLYQGESYIKLNLQRHHPCRFHIGLSSMTVC